MALGPVVFGWAAGSGIWNSQDTDVPAALGSQPGLLLSLIPVFGCRSHLIHIPMSTLHNLPQTLTAWELGKGKGQLMGRGRYQGGGEEEVSRKQEAPKAPGRQYSIRPPPPTPSAGPPRADLPRDLPQAWEGGFCMMCGKETVASARTLGSSKSPKVSGLHFIYKMRRFPVSETHQL